MCVFKYATYYNVLFLNFVEVFLDEESCSPWQYKNYTHSSKILVFFSSVILFLSEQRPYALVSHQGYSHKLCKYQGDHFKEKRTTDVTTLSRYIPNFKGGKTSGDPVTTAKVSVTGLAPVLSAESPGPGPGPGPAHHHWRPVRSLRPWACNFKMLIAVTHAHTHTHTL